MTRLLAVIGLLLLGGFVLSLSAPAPSVSGMAISPVPEDELWRLNSQ